jgi:hypothetical protein
VNVQFLDIHCMFNDLLCSLLHSVNCLVHCGKLYGAFLGVLSHYKSTMLVCTTLGVVHTMHFLAIVKFFCVFMFL